MNDRAVPDIDPRFDPRFQRGYVPDAAAPGHDQSPSHRPPDRAAPVTGFGDAGDTPLGPAGTRGTDIESPNPVTGTEAATDAAAADASADDPAVARFFEDSQGAASRFDPWFAAGWAVAVVVTVVGTSLWWAGISSENYMGPSNASDRWLQTVGWTVAPSLIEGGLLGIVAMLVLTGVRHAGFHREEPS